MGPVTVFSIYLPVVRPTQVLILKLLNFIYALSLVSASVMVHHVLPHIRFCFLFLMRPFLSHPCVHKPSVSSRIKCVWTPHLALPYNFV